MGKIRAVKLGDESAEKEQKRKAEARRQTKESKKKIEGVGLKGGERIAAVEGTEIKPEFKKLVDEVEHGEEQGEEKKERKTRTRKARVRSKRYQKVRSIVDKNKLYPLLDAIKLVKQTSMTKFDGTVELHVTLNVMSLNGKKDFRGTVQFPHSTGKDVRIAVADDAILASIEKGILDFDILVAHPGMMPELAKYARVLGPKGLMPNPKNGTVTTDVEKRVKELSTGQTNFKTEPDQPLIHLRVGKVSGEEKHIAENIAAVLDVIGKNKIVRASIAATMGPGVKIQL